MRMGTGDRMTRVRDQEQIKARLDFEHDGRGNRRLRALEINQLKIEGCRESWL